MRVDFRKALKQKLSKEAYDLITSNNYEFSKWIDRLQWYAEWVSGHGMKAKHYEELEEQGRLVELPCKVGDVVYKICPINKSIKMGDMRNGRIVKSDCQRCPCGSCSCLDIGFQKDADNIVREVVACDEDWIWNRRKHFGEIYFLTKPEAEQALANMVK